MNNPKILQDVRLIQSGFFFGDDGGFFVASMNAYVALSKIKKHSAHQAR